MIASDPGRASSRPPLLLGGLACACLALGAALGKLEESGAAPPDEFAEGETLYAAIPFLLILGCLAAAWALFRHGALVRGPGVLSRLLAAGLLIAVAGIAEPFLLFPGTALFLLGAVSLRVSREARRPGLPTPAPGPPKPVGILLGLLAASALSGAAGLLLGLADAASYTRSFVPRLITEAEYFKYRHALAGLASCFGLQVGALLVGGLLVVWLAHRIIALLGRISEPGRALLFWMLAGLAMGAGLVLIFRLTIALQLDEIGVSGELLLLAVLAGLGTGALAHRRLAVAIRTGPPPGLFGYTARGMLLVLVPPRFLLGRQRHDRVLRSIGLTVAAAMVTGTALLFLLSLSLYPEMEDFRSQVFDSYTYLAALLTTLLLLAPLLLLPRSRRRIAIAGLGLLFAASATLALQARRTGYTSIGLLAHEYSRLGSLLRRTVPARLLYASPRLGTEPVPGVEFVHHGPDEDRYSPHPDGYSPGEDLPPIVFLVWDAVRPDHTSVFGSTRETTPHLERFSRGAVRFHRAYSIATGTTGSLRCMLSGLYANRDMSSRDHPPLFTKDLAGLGYDRFVVTVTPTDINGVSGEAFERHWDSDGPGLRFHRIPTRYGDDHHVPIVFDTWRRLAAERPDRGLSGSFTYLHLNGPHPPWAKKSRTVEFGDRPEDLYDAQIATADRLLAETLDLLEELSALERVLFVFTADHGVGLMEHGRYGGFFPYEEQIRVPLIVRAPGLPAQDVRATVTHLDLVPTVLNLLTDEGAHRFHGRSLLPLMTGERESLPDRPRVSFNAFQDGFALTDAEGRYKLMHYRFRGYEGLFDLREDPDETRNLITKRPEVADRLRRLLAAFLWEGRNTYDRWR